MGAARTLFSTEAPEVIVAGPAGTGKTRAVLEYAHLLASVRAGMRVLSLRKTFASLKGSTLVTFDEQVMPTLDGVVFKGSTAKRPPQYVYPNGSTWEIGGMDKPGKIMSTDYDLVLAHETTDFEESDWEVITTRLRHQYLPWQQIIGDCNPAGPEHWIKRRADVGKLLLLESRHEDNPFATPAYLAKLDALTGVRYLRLRLGIWAAAEGMVYQDAWDRRRNLIDRFAIPREWPRHLAIDFGYTNPFVCQWWAEDPDGRLFMYRELYMTHRLIVDHCRQIKAVSRWGEKDGDPLPRSIVCDPSAAEAKAQLKQLLDMPVRDAPNDVLAGIQCVSDRMREAGDGRARLFILRDSLLERDHDLAEAKKPTCTVEEIEGYVWQTNHREAPVKEDDHGLDACRYLVASRDLRSRGGIFVEVGQVF